jgi:hypothetical protein
MHGFYRHPKAVEAGEDAADLFIRGVDYCTEYLTDGFIPESALHQLSRKRSVQRNAKALERVGLWDRDIDGWWIHHYDDFHPSKADVEAKKAKERARKGGQQKRGNRKSSAKFPRGIPANSTIQITDGQMADGQTTDVSPASNPPFSLPAITPQPVVVREAVDPENRDTALAELANSLGDEAPANERSAA